MKLILFLLIATTLTASHPALKRLQYGRDWVYQSILINGEEVYQSTCASGGEKVIEERYEKIKQVLDQFKRPFTVLDLGANNGYFSLRILQDFDAVCVVVDETERLTDICTLNTDTNRLIHLRKQFSKDDIKELKKREHFDVVLALHVLHHVDDWKSWIDTLFQLGSEVIIETPSINDPINMHPNTKRLANHLTSLPMGKEIGRFPRKDDFDHMLWFSPNQKAAKRLGILPSTFLKLSGAYPKRSYVNELNKKHGSDQWILQGIDINQLN